jgi:rod shape-determining protein MreD
MRWLVFLVFAYLMLGIQLGAGQQLAISGGGPNFVVLAVVFLCLNSTRGPAMLAAIVLGILQDLLTLQALGLYGLAYGLVGLLCSSTSQEVYPDHPLTHTFFGLVGQVIVAAVILLHSFVRPPEGLPHLPAWPLVVSCLYTAVLAPILLGILGKLKSLFGFEAPRRRVRPY